MPRTRPEARIGHENGKWQVSVRRGAESAAQAAWLSLGGCGDCRVAMRLWLALIATDDRR